MQYSSFDCQLIIVKVYVEGILCHTKHKSWGFFLNATIVPSHLSALYTFTSQQNRHVYLFRDAIDPNFLFLDNNLHPHRDTEVLGTLEGQSMCLIFSQRK